MADLHPSREALEKFAQGRLPLQEAARWEHHISDCDECGKILAQAGNDTFMDLLKEKTRLEAPVVMARAVNASAADLPLGLIVHKRYVVRQRLGQGGMGMVYHAIHRLMNRPVALKVIRSDLLATPLAVTRFRREVQAAAQLVHPNIVTAFDAEEAEGIHFLVMEYVDGKSLDQLVKQKGPLPPALVCNIARQIAQGLDQAHRLGMIHRDIKPSNIMITRQGKIKILDFGLARWSGRQGEPALPQITRDGSNLGTIKYAAPEQRKSAGDVDARADLYSLGASLVFLLTGKPPPLQLDDTQGSDFSLPPGTPPVFDHLIRQLLKFSPADRPQSAKVVIDTLSGIGGKQDIYSEQPASTRWLHYALLGSMALVVTLMIIIVRNWLTQPELHNAESTRSTSPVQTGPRPVETSPVATDTANTDPPVPLRENKWQSLLPLINPQRNAVAGTWKFVEEGLESEASRGGRLAIPAKLPSEYDLSVVFTRLTGKDTIGVVLTLADRRCTFELDAWEQHMAGFQNIAGQTMMQNSTMRRPYLLKNNRRYELLVEVRTDFIRASLDGKEVTQYQGDGSNLSIDNRYWAMPAYASLGLLSWESRTIFHSVEIKPIK